MNITSLNYLIFERFQYLCSYNIKYFLIFNSSPMRHMYWAFDKKLEIDFISNLNTYHHYKYNKISDELEVFDFNDNHINKTLTEEFKNIINQPKTDSTLQILTILFNKHDSIFAQNKIFDRSNNATLVHRNDNISSIQVPYNKRYYDIFFNKDKVLAYLNYSINRNNRKMKFYNSPLSVKFENRLSGMILNSV